MSNNESSSDVSKTYTDAELFDIAMSLIRDELEGATRKFGNFASAHEGYAVIKEELDELWEEVRRKNKNTFSMTTESIQVAAMGARFLVDVILRKTYVLNDSEQTPAPPAHEPDGT